MYYNAEEKVKIVWQEPLIGSHQVNGTVSLLCCVFFFTLFFLICLLSGYASSNAMPCHSDLLFDWTKIIIGRMDSERAQHIHVRIGVFVCVCAVACEMCVSFSWLEPINIRFLLLSIACGKDFMRCDRSNHVVHTSYGATETALTVSYLHLNSCKQFNVRCLLLS